jgi:hypothetical protein
MQYDGSDSEIKINFLHDYNYEFFWGMCHGAEISPHKVAVAEGSLFSKYCHERDDFETRQENLFTYNDHYFRVSWGNKPRSGFINIFSLNYHYFLQTNGGSEECVIPISKHYDEITEEIIPHLNDLIESTKEHEPYTVAWVFNAWEPQSGFNDIEWPFLKTLSPQIPIFTDNLLSNEELFEQFGVERKNRFKSYTQFVNSLFWPSTLHFREFYHHFDLYKNQSREKKWKFHYMTRRWYPDKLDVAMDLIDINKPDSIGITMSESFDKVKHLSTSEETLHGNDERWPELLNYFKDNPSELQYDKRGYNLDDFGGEWIGDNSRELLHKIYPLSNITILHEHQYHTSEKIIAHIILGKPFLPVYYKTLDNIQHMFDNDSELEIPPPPFERYETIHDIMDKITHLCNNEEDWIQFRDDMYEWVYEFRKVLLEYMNKHNSLFNAIIGNINKFKTKSNGK